MARPNLIGTLLNWAVNWGFAVVLAAVFIMLIIAQVGKCLERERRLEDALFERECLVAGGRPFIFDRKRTCNFTYR